MPDGEYIENGWVSLTSDIKLISDYSRIDFINCLELNCVDYKILFRDALILKLNESEKGREYLEDCYLLNQTNPDKNKLREVQK